MRGLSRVDPVCYTLCTQKRPSRETMRRREFVAALGGMDVFARAARAEYPERVRRVGVLIYGADDPVSETRVEGLRERLHRLDWVEGHNLALDFRFGAA